MTYKSDIGYKKGQKSVIFNTTICPIWSRLIQTPDRTANIE